MNKEQVNLEPGREGTFIKNKNSTVSDNKQTFRVQRHSIYTVTTHTYFKKQRLMK